MMQTDTILKLVAALRKAQKEFPVVKRDTTNPHFHSKYATLDGVIEALGKTLDNNGLTIFQPAVADPVNGYTGVTTYLYHESGEFIAETLLLPNTTTGGDKGNAQSATGCVTYARRTGYLSICGVTSEDDDGNTAVGQGRDTERKTTPNARPQAAAKTTTPVTPAAAKSTTKESASTAANSSSATAPATAAVAAATSATTSATSVNFADSTIPSEEQLKPYRNNITLLGEDLAKAGLKKSTGLPINRKILAYIKSVVGQQDATKITVGQWQQFFEAVRVTKGQENGINKLVEFVEKANA